MLLQSIHHKGIPLKVVADTYASLSSTNVALSATCLLGADGTADLGIAIATEPTDVLISKIGKLKVTYMAPTMDDESGNDSEDGTETKVFKNIALDRNSATLSFIALERLSPVKMIATLLDPRDNKTRIKVDADALCLLRPDLIIRNVNAPEEAVMGQAVEIDVVVAEVAGDSDATFDLVVKNSEDNAILMRENYMSVTNGGDVSTRFAIALEQVGTVQLLVQIVNTDPVESSYENNLVSIYIKIQSIGIPSQIPPTPYVFKYGLVAEVEQFFNDPELTDFISGTIGVSEMVMLKTDDENFRHVFDDWETHDDYPVTLTLQFEVDGNLLDPLNLTGFHSEPEYEDLKDVNDPNDYFNYRSTEDMYSALGCRASYWTYEDFNTGELYGHFRADRNIPSPYRSDGVIINDPPPYARELTEPLLFGALPSSSTTALSSAEPLFINNVARGFLALTTNPGIVFRSGWTDLTNIERAVEDFSDGSVGPPYHQKFRVTGEIDTTGYFGRDEPCEESFFELDYRQLVDTTQTFSEIDGSFESGRVLYYERFNLNTGILCDRFYAWPVTITVQAEVDGVLLDAHDLIVPPKFEGSDFGHYSDPATGFTAHTWATTDDDGSVSSRFGAIRYLRNNETLTEELSDYVPPPPIRSPPSPAALSSNEYLYANHTIRAFLSLTDVSGNVFQSGWTEPYQIQQHTYVYSNPPHYFKVRTDWTAQGIGELDGGI